MPLVLGHEGAGVVEEVGPGVRDIAVGDHVVLSWFAPCRRCAYCVTGRAWACTTTRADYCVMEDGTTRLRRLNGDTLFPFLAVGSFARHAVVPESGAVVVPDAVPAAVAALIGCAVTTGVGAVLNTARVPAGSAAAVIGCGGVGLAGGVGLRLSGGGPLGGIPPPGPAPPVALAGRGFPTGPRRGGRAGGPREVRRGWGGLRRP